LDYLLRLRQTLPNKPKENGIIALTFAPFLLGRRRLCPFCLGGASLPRHLPHHKKNLELGGLRNGEIEWMGKLGGRDLEMAALSGQQKSATSEPNPRSTVGYIFSGMVKG